MVPGPGAHPPWIGTRIGPNGGQELLPLLPALQVFPPLDVTGALPSPPPLGSCNTLPPHAIQPVAPNTTDHLDSIQV